MFAEADVDPETSVVCIQHPCWQQLCWQQLLSPVSLPLTEGQKAGSGTACKDKDKVDKLVAHARPPAVYSQPAASYHEVCSTCTISTAVATA